VVVVLVLNWAVALAKLLVGKAIGSLSLVADGYHSLVDGLSNVVGLIGITVSMNPPDEGHPYGHRKFETLASLMGAFLILLTATEVLRDAWAKLMGHEASGAAAIVSSWGGFATVIATLVVNVCVATWERHQAKKLSSEFLMVDSGHTYSDVLVTLGVLASLFAARVGYPAMDSLMGAFIGLFIGYIGLNLLHGPIEVLSDAQAVPVEDVEAIVRGVEGVAGCHKVRSRGKPELFFFMELHIQVSPNITVEEGHRLSHVVKAKLQEKWPRMSDAVIHVEPDHPDHGH
jgi:cation diffusion facilitator family transporter